MRLRDVVVLDGGRRRRRSRAESNWSVVGILERGSQSE